MTLTPTPKNTISKKLAAMANAVICAVNMKGDINMVINVTESMARLEEIKNNTNEINQKLQGIEQLLQELEAPMLPMPKTE